VTTENFVLDESAKVQKVASALYSTASDRYNSLIRQVCALVTSLVISL